MRHRIAGWLRDLAWRLDPTPPFRVPFGGSPLRLAFDEDDLPLARTDSAQAVLEEMRLAFWCFEHECVRRSCDHKHPPHCDDPKCEAPLGHAPPHRRRTGTEEMSIWRDDEPLTLRKQRDDSPPWKRHG